MVLMPSNSNDLSELESKNASCERMLDEGSHATHHASHHATRGHPVRPLDRHRSPGERTIQNLQPRGSVQKTATTPSQCHHQHHPP